MNLGFNSDLLYVISNGDFDSVFKIDTLTGELFVDAQLDRETTTDYLLNITVQDQGSPRSKAVSKLLHIIIEDVNDNAPQFIKSSFSFFFPENTPKGKPDFFLKKRKKYIIYLVKMESEPEITILGLKTMVKSGLDIF